MRPRRLSDLQAKCLVRAYDQMREKFARSGSKFNQFDVALSLRHWAWSIWNVEFHTDGRVHMVWMKRTYAGREAKRLSVGVNDLAEMTESIQKMSPEAIVQYVKRTRLDPA